MVDLSSNEIDDDNMIYNIYFIWKAPLEFDGKKRPQVIALYVPS